MLISEDGERMPLVNNGISMLFQRQSKTISGKLILLTSKVTVDQAISDVLQPIQDGGNSLDIRELM
jgi:hypothetical protein